MSKHSVYHASGVPDGHRRTGSRFDLTENTVDPPRLPFNIEITLAHIKDDAVRQEFIRTLGGIGLQLGLNLTDQQVITLRRQAEARIKAGKERKQRRDNRPAPTNAVVYYARFAPDIIKIGTSTDIEGRMKAMYRRADDLLATEPGDIRLERMRHEQFAADRAEWEGSREMFNLSPALRAHIDILNKHQANAA